MIYRTVTVNAILAGSVVEVSPSLSGNISVTAEVINKMAHSEMPTYEGEYEFTPSEETQVAPTACKALVRDIVINPVPSNYARMAWNGSTILFY